MARESVLQLRALCRDIAIAEPVVRYAARLTRASDPSAKDAPDVVKKAVRFGAAVRGAQSLVLAAKAVALCEGRPNVSFNDIQKVSKPALRHRGIIRSFEGEGRRRDDRRDRRGAPRRRPDTPVPGQRGAEGAGLMGATTHAEAGPGAGRARRSVATPSSALATEPVASASASSAIERDAGKPSAPPARHPHPTHLRQRGGRRLRLAGLRRHDREPDDRRAQGQRRASVASSATYVERDSFGSKAPFAVTAGHAVTVRLADARAQRPGCLSSYAARERRAQHRDRGDARHAEHGGGAADARRHRQPEPPRHSGPRVAHHGRRTR